MDRDDPESAVPPPPRYAGEDTRLTSEKELWGWYSYGWSAEVFVVSRLFTRNGDVGCEAISTFDMLTYYIGMRHR